MDTTFAHAGNRAASTDGRRSLFTDIVHRVAESRHGAAAALLAEVAALLAEA